MFRVREGNRKWWVLAAMGAGGGLIMLDETVVGIALPTIQHDLKMADVTSHWVVNAYMLVFAAFAAASGKLGDLFGFRALLICGSVLFGMASLACGLSGSGAWLVTARLVQGLGAAAIFPATVAMIMIAFPEEQRGMAMGVLAAVGTTFLAIGPLVGGLLTELVSWRWIFWINVPVVTAIVMIVFAIWREPPRKTKKGAFDGPGLVALVLGLGLIVSAVMQSADWGWGRPITLALGGGGVLALVIFVRLELRRPNPLIEVDLFRYASFSACAAVLFVGQFCKIALVVFAALFLQNKLNMSPFQAGLALLVCVAAFPFLSAPVGHLADRLGSRLPVLVGLSSASAAMLWIGIAVNWQSYLALLPGLVLWGLAMPCCYPPTIRAMANAVPKEKQGQTSGIGVTARLLGGTISVAVCSAVLTLTGSYGAVFLTTAALMIVALILAFWALDRETV